MLWLVNAAVLQAWRCLYTASWCSATAGYIYIHEFVCMLDCTPVEGIYYAKVLQKEDIYMRAVGSLYGHTMLLYMEEQAQRAAGANSEAPQEVMAQRRGQRAPCVEVARAAKKARYYAEE